MFNSDIRKLRYTGYINYGVLACRDAKFVGDATKQYVDGWAGVWGLYVGAEPHVAPVSDWPPLTRHPNVSTFTD